MMYHLMGLPTGDAWMADWLRELVAQAVFNREGGNDWVGGCCG